MESEYILPIRIDDSELPGLPATVAYIDARKLTSEEIIDLILGKLGRNEQRLFRGIDLGHKIDPLRSALAKMDANLFEEIVDDILICYKYQTVSKAELSLSVLSGNNKLGSGIVRTGVFSDTFQYAQQLFTEIGSGIDENISKLLGKENYFSSGGKIEELIGSAVVVTHSLIENEPSKEDVLAFGNEIMEKGFNKVIFMVNEGTFQTSYYGFERALRQIDLFSVVLCLEDLAFQILTTDVFRKYEDRLLWKYKNPL